MWAWRLPCPMFLWKIKAKSDTIKVLNDENISNAFVKRMIDVKTKIDYYSRLSVCGENDSDTETFYFL